MIKLDISLAIFLYLFSTVIGIFIVWIWTEKKPGLSLYLKNDDNVWQCSVCSYMYTEGKTAGLSRCPRCNSINKREVQGA